MELTRDFPHWQSLYEATDVASMPWYFPGLDPDLKAALVQFNLTQGRFLDIGTGPGTQAIALAELGFEVTATDLSLAAIEKAQHAETSAKVTFLQDDILNSSLTGPFEAVFDRGCFHVLSPETRSDYVKTVANLVAPGGFLFLKTFSHDEPMQGGPYRFTVEALQELFEPALQLISSKPTVYHGTLNPFPKALFLVLKRV